MAWVKEPGYTWRGDAMNVPRRFQVNVSLSLYASCSTSNLMGINTSDCWAILLSSAFALWTSWLYQRVAERIEHSKKTNNTHRRISGRWAPRFPFDRAVTLADSWINLNPGRSPRGPNQSCLALVSRDAVSNARACWAWAPLNADSYSLSLWIHAFTLIWSAGAMTGKGSPGIRGDEPVNIGFRSTLNGVSGGWIFICILIEMLNASDVGHSIQGPSSSYSKEGDEILNTGAIDSSSASSMNVH